MTHKLSQLQWATINFELTMNNELHPRNSESSNPPTFGSLPSSTGQPSALVWLPSVMLGL